MAIAKEGIPFIAASLLLNLLFLKICPWAGVGSLALTLFIVFFFRDPRRVTQPQEDAILSPADGRITEAGPEKISIYLSLLDVHVNRSPVGGIVESIKYSPGRFHPAFDKNALTENENNLIYISNGRMKIAVLVVTTVEAGTTEENSPTMALRIVARFGPVIAPTPLEYIVLAISARIWTGVMEAPYAKEMDTTCAAPGM